MKIWIKLEKGPPFFIPIPNILLNNVLTKILDKVFEKTLHREFLPIDFRQLRRELSHMKRRHRGVPLIDVQSSSGEHVKIMP